MRVCSLIYDIRPTSWWLKGGGVLSLKGRDYKLLILVSNLYGIWDKFGFYVTFKKLIKSQTFDLWCKLWGDVRKVRFWLLTGALFKIEVGGVLALGFFKIKINHFSRYWWLFLRLWWAFPDQCQFLRSLF